MDIREDSDMINVKEPVVPKTLFVYARNKDLYKGKNIHEYRLLRESKESVLALVRTLQKLSTLRKSVVVLQT